MTERPSQIHPDIFVGRGAQALRRVERFFIDGVLPSHGFDQRSTGEVPLEKQQTSRQAINECLKDGKSVLFLKIIHYNLASRS